MLDSYTAVLVQAKVEFAYQRSQIGNSLERYLKQIDSIARRFGDASPLKLISFPEFFLQGFTTKPEVDLPYYRKEILITIPGPETDLLAAKARQYGTYIAGTSLEHDPLLPDYLFNCSYIISPQGEIIHKYRKAIPAIHAEMAMSPHDLLDRYMEVYGRGKSVLETVFPVTDTEIGRVGFFVCMDGHFPEVTRALALQGAEILLRPAAFPEPLVSSPMNTWEIQNRARAHENMAYVLATNTGALVTEELPGAFTPGDSMIVDYQGRIVGRAPYAGDSLVGGEINLAKLRKQRLHPKRNFLTQLRTELFRSLYEDPIYPKNQFAERGIQQRSETTGRDTSSVVEHFIQKGIYPPRTNG